MWPPPGPPGHYAPPTVYQQPAPGYGYYPGQPAANPYPNMYGPPPGTAPPGQPPPGAPGYAPPPGAPPAQQQAVAAYTPPVPPPMPVGPMKKAVLIGCTYPGTSAKLNGCINDIKCMKHLLMTRFGFQESNIVMLKDDVYHPDFLPTRSNIYRSMQWLMTGMQPGTSLFFHFSGHGSQKADYSGDEEDGMDETILPTDYNTAGQIIDDEINQRLVRPLPPGVTLHAVIDACHSGTVIDLPYRTKWKSSGMYWKGRPRPDKGTAGGTALQLGACRDSQVAQDTNRMSGNVHTGAATFSFIQAVERGGVQQSYAQVLSSMHMALEAQSGPAPSAGLGMVFGLLLGGPMSTGQTPVLSCDKPIDLNTRLML